MRNTQRETVLLGAYFLKKVQVKDYMSGEYFVGYEAGTKISRLVSRGLLQVVDHTRPKTYGLTNKGAGIVRELLAGNKLIYTKGFFKLKNEPSLFHSILSWAKSAVKN